MMIDAHCHVDLFKNPDSIVKECDEIGIAVIAVTNCPDHFKVGRPHLVNSKRVRLAVGLHPVLCDHSERTLRDFEDMVEQTSYVGEVGLDFSKDRTTEPATQIKSFEIVLKASSSRTRIVSIHSRHATHDVLDMLKMVTNLRGVFHWYSGPISLLGELQSQGHYISVNTAMLQSYGGRKIVENVERSRVLTESDGPYVGIGKRRARPRDMHLVLGELGKIWSISATEAECVVECNFRKLIDPLSTSAICCDERSTAKRIEPGREYKSL